MSGPLPVYPRATDLGSGPDGMNGGIVHELVTDDAYDQVYKWYKSKMPPHSELDYKGCAGMKMPANAPPQEVALFSVGTLGKDYRAAFIVGIPREPPTRADGWPQGKPLPHTIIMLKVR